MKIVRKLFAALLTVAALTFLTFVAFQVIPGDRALVALGTNATPEEVEALREEMGLNDPLLTRYTKWLFSALRGDFGESERYRMPVTELLADMLPVTLWLAGVSLVLIFLLSFPLGLLCGRYPGSILDRAVTFCNQLFLSVPSFFLGILLSYVFGILLGWFTQGRYVPLSEDPAAFFGYLLYPAAAIALPKVAMTVKFLRSSILRETGKDYVRTARSKGQSEGKILTRHILKNAMIPVITFLGVIAAEVLAGSIVVEQVFSVRGVGRLLVASIANRDYPVVQAIVLYIGVAVIVVNALVDLAYRMLDPRVARQ